MADLIFVVLLAFTFIGFGLLARRSESRGCGGCQGACSPEDLDRNAVRERNGHDGS